MKAFGRLCIVAAAVFVIIAVAANVYFVKQKESAEGLYRVEANRLADEIEETGSFDLSKYPHITGVFSDEDGKLYSSDEHYVIIEAGGKL